MFVNWKYICFCFNLETLYLNKKKLDYEFEILN